MPRDYAIEIVGATRTERGILDVERSLARELRQATRETRALLLEAAIEAAPTPRRGQGEKGDGVGARINFPEAHGGLRRLAGRAPGGAPLVSLTYQVELFVEAGELAAYFETGTGLFGPAGSKYPIYPSAGKALYLRGWGGNQGSPFRGGSGSLRSGRGSSLQPAEQKPIFDHVVHPGIRARPFLEKSARDNADAVDVLYDQAVHRAVHGF